jgi:mannosyltransferase
MAADGDVLERVRPAVSDGSGTVCGLPLPKLAAKAMRAVWVWPALLMFVVGCYRVTGPELWRDELSSWSFASRPVPELVTIVRHSDASQLAYYLLLHYWIAVFGDSVLAMRLLSVLAMTGAAACVSLVGRRLAGDKAGLLAGLLFALVPSISRFAQETRLYALEVLVAIVATLLLLRALDKPSWRKWAAYAGCVAVLGYVDLVALCLIAGHAAAVALRWWSSRAGRDETGRDGGGRDRAGEAGLAGWAGGMLAFALAAAAGCLVCLPMALVGLGQAGSQLNWLVRPGLSLSAFSFFGRNLFYSTSAAAALIIVAVLAWAVAWQAAAIASAIAVVPVAVMWVVSQGPNSYFFPRYLLLTVAAWAILGGITLSKLDVRVAAAAVLVFGILGAGDQRVIREPGAHNWAEYPLNDGTQYWDFAGAARVVAAGARSGDGIVYPGWPGRWMMIDYGVRYYLGRDLPAGLLPREIFVSRTAAQAGTLYPGLCQHPARCLGPRQRVWTVVYGWTRNPYRGVPKAEAAVLRRDFHVKLTRHVSSLTVFLLARNK